MADALSLPPTNRLFGLQSMSPLISGASHGSIAALAAVVSHIPNFTQRRLKAYRQITGVCLVVLSAQFLWAVFYSFNGYVLIRLRLLSSIRPARAIPHTRRPSLRHNPLPGAGTPFLPGEFWFIQSALSSANLTVLQCFKIMNLFDAHSTVPSLLSASNCFACDFCGVWQMHISHFSEFLMHMLYKLPSHVAAEHRGQVKTFVTLSEY